MPRLLHIGCMGPEVTALQARLNGLPPHMPPFLSTDGIFGAKTDLRVREFQRDNGLVADGYVGPMTWAKLTQLGDGSVKAKHFCDCCAIGPAEAELRTVLAAHLEGELANASALHASSAPGGVANAFGFLPGLPPIPSLPSAPKLTRVTAAQKTVIDASYGSSIDYSTVFLSDKTGANGRAFVLAVPSPLPLVPTIQIVNIGTTFTDHTLVHEFGHVWQSQHHSSSTQYMVNAVASQAAAEVANKLMGVSSFSAYGYIPGKPFKEYAAEQIAQMVANGEAPIVAHVKSIAKGAIDADLKLSVARIEDTAAPGVKH